MPQERECAQSARPASGGFSAPSGFSPRPVSALFKRPPEPMEIIVVEGYRRNFPRASKKKPPLNGGARKVL